MDRLQPFFCCACSTHDTRVRRRRQHKDGGRVAGEVGGGSHGEQLWAQLGVCSFGKLAFWAVPGGRACRFVTPGLFGGLFFGVCVCVCHCFLNWATSGHSVPPPQPWAAGVGMQGPAVPIAAALLPCLQYQHRSSRRASVGSRAATCSLAAWAKRSCSSPCLPCILLVG